MKIENSKENGGQNEISSEQNSINSKNNKNAKKKKKENNNSDGIDEHIFAADLFDNNENMLDRFFEESPHSEQKE